MEKRSSATAPWALPADVVSKELGTEPEQGLSKAEAEQRLKKSGLNKLAEPIKITFGGVFWEEIREPMILLLLVVGIIYAVWGELRDVITIFSVITLLVVAEVFTEYRAKSAISALRKLTPSITAVIREGKYIRIPAQEVVVGDIIPLEAGDRVPADARVFSSFGLQADESALTGESVPVPKENRQLAENTPVADRSNMVFAGTVITSGTGMAIVTATGIQTEIGKIQGLVREAKQPRTPLQRTMKELSGLLVWVAIGFSIIIPLIGILQGKPYQEMILTGLSLAFAVIPEELPIIVTMVLGLGSYALSKKNVLIRSLRVAETLGLVNVIVTDKTGTITENRMTVSRILADGVAASFPAQELPPAVAETLKAGVLASVIKKAPDGGYTGDPMEVALLEAAVKSGLSPETIQSRNRKIQEFPFDNNRKMMSIAYDGPGTGRVYAKGAPEIILAKSERKDLAAAPLAAADRDNIAAKIEAMGAEGMRVIAVAYKDVQNPAGLTREQAESGLVFLGLVGIIDPARKGVAEAMQATRQAGIRTIMVTGDMPLTAERVAREVGIADGGRLVRGSELAQMSEDELKARVMNTDIFARIDPAQKYRIVKGLQANGQLVAVTGDGINDSPALKTADIGIAMGETGTEAAREAASMVLVDDSYISIVEGVKQGRKIFDNLRKGLQYYLGVKVALVLSFLVPLALNLPFPFAPIQIVLLELFMDLAASATFVAEPVEPDVMKRKPRDPRLRFVDKQMLTSIALAAVSLAAAVLFNYLLAYYSGMEEIQARTIAFGTWMIGHVFLALTMRSQRETLFKIGLLSNPVMLIWAAAAVIFLVVITTVPALQGAIRVTSLSLTGWLMILVTPFVTVFWHEIKKALSH